MMLLIPAGRAGMPDEVANVAALLMGAVGAFITGSDILIDGGVTDSYFYGEMATYTLQKECLINLKKAVSSTLNSFIRLG